MEISHIQNRTIVLYGLEFSKFKSSAPCKLWEVFLFPLKKILEIGSLYEAWEFSLLGKFLSKNTDF